jgi:DNA primase
MSLQLSRIFEQFLGDSKKHNESKGQISFDCPACSNDKGMPEGDGKGNLEINYNRGVFKCWACAETNRMKGGIPYLMRRYADDRLLQRYYTYRPEHKAFDSEGSEHARVKLPKEYKPLAKLNSSQLDYDKAMDYLTNRNISKAMIEKYEIGMCAIGEYQDRIIIPSRDEFGDINYFIARGYHKRVWPKYKNPEANKEELIFNERFINWDSTIYLVEGAFDHIVIPNSIPLLGKFITPKLLYLLITKAKANVVVVLDADAIDDAKRLYKELNMADLYNRVRICIPEDGLDPSLIYEKWGSKGIFKFLRTAYKLPESEIY